MGSSKKSTDLYKQAGDQIEMLRKSSRSRNSRSRPSSTKFPKSQHQQRVSSKDNNNNGDMSGMQNDLSRSVEGGKYRNKVLAEVGLDDILVDGYDEEVDIDQQQQHNFNRVNPEILPEIIEQGPLWPSPPGTIHFLIEKFSYFVIRFSY